MLHKPTLHRRFPSQFLCPVDNDTILQEGLKQVFHGRINTANPSSMNIKLQLFSLSRHTSRSSLVLWRLSLPLLAREMLFLPCS